MPSRGWFVAGLAVVLSVGGAFGARGMGIRPVQIQSNSMAPTVAGDDWIVVRDLDRDDADEVERGDIVMFRFPLGTSGRAIKRVIAAGGDRVAIRRRSVTVNRHAIAIAGAPGAYAGRSRVEVVPRGHVFLLGDNPSRSIDSRSFGPVPTTEIVARELLIIGKPPWTTIAAIALTLCALLLLVAWRRPAKLPANDDAPLLNSAAHRAEAGPIARSATGTAPAAALELVARGSSRPV